MLLRNFYNILALMMIGDQAVGNTGDYGNGSLNMKRLNGSIYQTLNNAITSSYWYAYFPMGRINDISSGLGVSIAFGTGNTPVSYDDYTLTNYTFFQCNNISADATSYDPSTNTYSVLTRMTLKNNKSSDLTVKEIGIAANQYVLIYREVLDTPITIPVGKQITYTHEFKFTMPV